MTRIVLLLALLSLAAVRPSVAQVAPAPPDATPAAQRVLIDVRSPEEYAQGHLEGAVNIPHDVIGERIGEVAKSRETPITLYCRSGRRSGMALETLGKRGYRNVENAGAYEDLKKRR